MSIISQFLRSTKLFAGKTPHFNTNIIDMNDVCVYFFNHHALLLNGGGDLNITNH